MYRAQWFRPTLAQPSSTSSQRGPALPVPATGVECHSSTDSGETGLIHGAKDALNVLRRMAPMRVTDPLQWSD